MKWIVCALLFSGMVWGDTLLFKDEGKVNNFDKHAKMDVPLIENSPWWEKDSWQQWDKPEKEKPIRIKKPVVNMPLLENSPWWDTEQWQAWETVDEKPAPQKSTEATREKPVMAKAKPEMQKTGPEAEAGKLPAVRQWKESKN